MTMPNMQYYQYEIIERSKKNLTINKQIFTNTIIDSRDEKERNALYWAIKNQNIHNVKLLVEHKINLNVTPDKHAIFYAIDEEFYEAIHFLISSGVDANIADSKGRSILMYAIEKEQLQTVAFIVKNGVDLFSMDDNYDMAEDYVNRCNNKMIKDYMQYIYKLNEEAEKENMESLCSICKDVTCLI